MCSQFFENIYLFFTPFKRGILRRNSQFHFLRVSPINSRGKYDWDWKQKFTNSLQALNGRANWKLTLEDRRGRRSWSVFSIFAMAFPSLLLSVFSVRQMSLFLGLLEITIFDGSYWDSHLITFILNDIKSRNRHTEISRGLNSVLISL